MVPQCCEKNKEKRNKKTFWSKNKKGGFKEKSFTLNNFNFKFHFGWSLGTINMVPFRNTLFWNVSLFKVS